MRAMVDWQTHLAHRQAMALTLGGHLSECFEMHDPLAGLLGPDGSMLEMMAGEIVR